MILTEENCGTGRETWASATFATINPTWTVLGDELGPVPRQADVRHMEPYRDLTSLNE